MIGIIIVASAGAVDKFNMAEVVFTKGFVGYGFQLRIKGKCNNAEMHPWKTVVNATATRSEADFSYLIWRVRSEIATEVLN